jgi:hypothetical protein
MDSWREGELIVYMLVSPLQLIDELVLFLYLNLGG